MLRFGCLKGLLRTLNHPPRRLTNRDRIIVIPRWHFIVTPDLSDRRHSNSDYATPAQFYRGNLPHCHWPGRRIPPVKTLIPRSSRTHFLAWKVRRHTPTSVLKLFKTTLSTADLRWLPSRTEYVRCLRIAFAVFTLAVAGPSVALRLSGS